MTDLMGEPGTGGPGGGLVLYTRSTSFTVYGSGDFHATDNFFFVNLRSTRGILFF